MNFSEHQSYGAELYTKIIDHLDHPQIKLQMISIFLRRMDHKHPALKPRSIYIRLRTYEDTYSNNFTEPTPAPDANSDSQNSGNKTKNDISIYPYFRKQNRRYTSSLSDQKIIELLLAALNAYASDARLNELKLRIAKGDELDKKHEMEVKAYHRITSGGQTKNSSYKQVFGPAVINADTLANLAKSINIVVSGEVADSYRDDIKFYDMIIFDKSLENLRKRFKPLFPVSN